MQSFKISILELADCGGLVNLNRKSHLLKRIKENIRKDPDSEEYTNSKFVISLLSKLIGSDLKSDIYIAKVYFLEKLIDRHYSYQMEYKWHDLKALLFFVIRLDGIRNFKELEMTLTNPLFHIQIRKYLPSSM